MRAQRPVRDVRGPTSCHATASKGVATIQRSPGTISGRNPKPDDASSGQDLRVSLLGRFEVSAGSRVIREEEWRLRKAASLFKVLAISRNPRLHREQVMEMLWPDLAPSAAADNLHQALHVARCALEPPTFAT
jgi:two-component SAPR family response regulator